MEKVIHNMSIILFKESSPDIGASIVLVPGGLSGWVG